MGGIPESIEDGQTGLLFDAGDAHNLAEKIRWMRGHPDEAETMGREGRKSVVEKCNSHYETLSALYETVIAEAGA